MIAAAALALTLAAQDPLAGARAALASGDAALAERLALEAAAPPREAEALYLVGVARFRAGRPAEALEALDRAGPQGDAPGPWHYNRGACLLDLGRPEEAERAFVAAAAGDEALAAVALVNAGFAALDAGALDRARAHAAAAAAAASEGPGADLVRDLERAVAAAALETQPAERTAETPPEAAWSAQVRLEAGWDTNALQTGAAGAGDRFRPDVEATGSALAAAQLTVGWSGARGGQRLEAGYALASLTYEAEDARDWSLQQHAVAVGIVLAPRGRLRLGASAEGQLAFTGLDDLRGLTAGAGLRGWAAFAETSRTTTRLEAAGSARRGLAEFDHLGGPRLEAGLSQDLVFEALALRGGYRLLAEGAGTLRTATTSPPSPMCELMGCTAETVTTFGYVGHLGWAAARYVPVARLTLEVSAGLERRLYLEDDRFLVSEGTGDPVVRYRERRRDWRLTAVLGAAWRLGDHASLTGRWEVVRNASTLGAQRDDCAAALRCPPSPLGDRNHLKNLFSVGASFDW